MFVIIGILAFSLLVLIHELGHFIAAKIIGIKVEEFAIGFGPKLACIQGHETAYCIRALPFGGFVKMTGMGFGEEIPEIDKPRSYEAQSALKRTITVIAGPFMNLFLAVVLFWLIYLIMGIPQFPSDVHALDPKGPAAKIGVMPRDKIIEIDGEAMADAEGIVANIKDKAGTKVELVVLRDKEKMVFHPTLAKKENGDGYVGVEFAVTFVKGQPIAAGISSLKATGQGIAQVFSMLGRLPELMKPLLTGQQTGISGPVGIFKMTKTVAYQGIIALMAFIAVLSISLGVFNILPIPPLDGGHVLFAVIELIIRRPVNKDLVMMLQTLGFLVLVTFMLLVTYSDVIHPIPIPKM